MKLLLTVNFQNKRKYPFERLENELKAQIENSLNMGWKTKDIILVTNFDYEFMGVYSTQLPMKDFCLTGSKTFAVHELFKRNLVNETLWSHDLDLWQAVPLTEEPDILDAGISTYSSSKFNGGSVFYKPSAKDIVEETVNVIVNGKEQKEEPTINTVFKSDKFKDRVTVMNTRFNVGCSGFVERYNRSVKPVVGVHFHPTNRIAYDTMCRDRNLLGEVPVTQNLHNLFLKYFGDSIKRFTYHEEERGYTGDWNIPECISLT